MGIKVGDGGTGKTIRSIRVGDGGAGKPVRRVILGDGGAGKVVWTAGRIMYIQSTYVSSNNAFEASNASGATELVSVWSVPTILFRVPVICDRDISSSSGSKIYPANSVIPSGFYVKPTTSGQMYTFMEAV